MICLNSCHSLKTMNLKVIRESPGKTAESTSGRISISVKTLTVHRSGRTRSRRRPGDPRSDHGPIGITLELKRRGYGKKLLDYCLEKATALGFGAVLFEKVAGRLARRVDGHFLLRVVRHGLAPFRGAARPGDADARGLQIDPHDMPRHLARLVHIDANVLDAGCNILRRVPVYRLGAFARNCRACSEKEAGRSYLFYFHTEYSINLRRINQGCGVPAGG